MLDNVNAYVCLDCWSVAGPYSKRRMNTMDGKRCAKCKGKLIPAYIGIDLAKHVEMGIEQGGLSPAT